MVLRFSAAHLRWSLLWVQEDGKFQPEFAVVIKCNIHSVMRTKQKHLGWCLIGILVVLGTEPTFLSSLILIQKSWGFVLIDTI